MSDGVNTIQGVRSYDPAMGTWTTPDAYVGDASDPMSRKSYMWDGNNSYAYSDPTGYSTDPGSAYPGTPAIPSSSCGASCQQSMAQLDALEAEESQVDNIMLSSEAPEDSAAAASIRSAFLDVELSVEQAALEASSSSKAAGPHSTYDTSLTKPGSVSNVLTNVSRDDFEANLIDSGFTLTGVSTKANGPVFVLGKGTSSYTTYTRTSTGEFGALFFNEDTGVKVKFLLGGSR